MAKIVDVKIGKVNVKIRKFGVIMANEKLADLSSFLAPIGGSLLSRIGIQALAGNYSDNKEQTKKDNGMFTDEFDKLSRINSKSLHSISNLLLVPEYIQIQLKDGSFVNYGEDVIDDVFEDEPERFIELIIKVIQVNFTSFFTRLLGGSLDEKKLKAIISNLKS